MLPPRHSGPGSLGHDGIKALTIFKLSIVLQQEVPQVKLRNINVFICVVHIFCQVVDQPIEHDRGFVVELAELLFLLVDEVYGELGGPAVIQLVCDFNPLVVKLLLLELDLLEDRNTGRWVHESTRVHIRKELADRVLVFQLVEAYNGLFPVIVVLLELFLVA